MRRVLVLGAGLVAAPLVRYLLDRQFDVVVASRTQSKAARLVGDHPRGRALGLGAEDEAALCALVHDCDVAVSLLPAERHPVVARVCVQLGKHLVTTSYVSEAMRALDAQARRRGLLLLNEMGVDPGIDHMSALHVIRRRQAQGATLVGFTSYCGGLPAPEANDNPFGYKFSWAPRGVLVAARQPARYLLQGESVVVPNERLFAQPAHIEIPGVGKFEGYPNRDSCAYIGSYGFDKRVSTMLRGTLRNPGHCQLYAQLIALGLLELGPVHDYSGLSYSGFLERLFGAPLSRTIPDRLGVTRERSPLPALEYIGLLDDRRIEIERGTTLDLMSDRMQKTLSFRRLERDMLLMRHDLDFELANGERERVTATLVCFGTRGGDSAMARTVSLPAAIAVRLLLEGKLSQRGVSIPLEPSLYEPVLQELAERGIAFEESCSPLA